MATLNYKHLRYFWAVARSGSIARASQQLHLTPQSISGQLHEFEASLGVPVLRRVGRGLELTEAGKRILDYAEKIFALGDELMQVASDEATQRSLPFAVGIADSVPKMIAYRLVEPALRSAAPIRLICREGRLATLLSELAIHRLDLVIADRAMPTNLNVRGYSHLLGESSLVVCGTAALCKRLKGKFPASMHDAPFLMPGDDVAARRPLEQWFESHSIRPKVVGYFDDSALLKAFGEAGAGLFVVPSAIEAHVSTHYGVETLGRIESVKEQLFAITTERRLTHPAVVSISEAARREVFVEQRIKKVSRKSAAAARRPAR